ncbi:hypothetical protein WJX84_008042 [Apatococcus fuscideae]|uniref:Chromo domain-containing protein n=1 Tax=Apatococcus fuscideae TaxID=2026836 RepID=A0AAW1TK11_9CHLO
MSIPKPWSEIYIGRAVSRTQGKHTQNGFVYRYASTKATGTEYIRRFVVKWEKGEDEPLLMELSLFRKEGQGGQAAQDCGVERSSRLLQQACPGSQVKGSRGWAAPKGSCQAPGHCHQSPQTWTTQRGPHGPPPKALKAAADSPPAARKAADRPSRAAPARTKQVLIPAQPAEPEEEMVKIDRITIPKRLTLTAGDKLRADYAGQVFDEDLEVEHLCAERSRRGRRQFLVKYKGYELDPNDWLPEEGLEQNVALDVWESSQQ